MSECCTVEVVHDGQLWLVAPSYVHGVGIGEAEQIALDAGCELPTPGLVDAIWRAADLKLTPMPRRHNGTLAQMASDEVMQDQAQRIEAQIDGQKFRLLAGTHKDVVRIGKRVGLYGWHRPNGSVIQPPYLGHASAWKDYSQGLRLVRKA